MRNSLGSDFFQRQKTTVKKTVFVYIMLAIEGGVLMGYFDDLFDGIFKTNSKGNSFFYPWGFLGKGYILPDAKTKQKILNVIANYYIISFIFLLGVGVYWDWLYALALLPIFFMWYYLTYSKLTKKLLVTNSRLNLRESFKNSANSHKMITLWAMFTASLAFLLFFLVLLTSKKTGLIEFAGVTFFGICSIAFGYMIKVRNA